MSITATCSLATPPAAQTDSIEQDRDEEPDALAKKFAELLAQWRARAAAEAKKAPQEPPQKEVPQALAPKPVSSPVSSSAAAGDETLTIERMVLRDPDELAAVARDERIGRLVLTGDSFVNWSLRGLSGLTVLELSIEAAQVSDAGLQHVRAVKGLRCLRLWTPGVDDDALAYVAELPGLEILDLEGTAIEGAGLAKLSGLQTLDMLALGPKMGDSHIASLRQLPALRQLDLRACRELTPACLEPLAQLADLKTVWLPGHLRTQGKRVLQQLLPTCEVR